MEKIVFLGVSIILLGSLMFDYFQNTTKLTAILFFLCLISLLSFYLIRNTKVIIPTNSNNNIISILNLVITFILVICAIYTVNISHKTAKIASDDFKYRMKPQIISRISKIDEIKNRLVFKCSLENKGISEIIITDIKVFIINLEMFKKNNVTEIINSVDINFESYYLPRDAKSTYDFDMAKEDLSKFENNKYGFLNEIVYSDYRGNSVIHNWITFYTAKPEIDKFEFSTYKIWTG